MRIIRYPSHARLRPSWGKIRQKTCEYKKRRSENNQPKCHQNSGKIAPVSPAVNGTLECYRSFWRTPSIIILGMALSKMQTEWRQLISPYNHKAQDYCRGIISTAKIESPF